MRVRGLVYCGLRRWEEAMDALRTVRGPRPVIVILRLWR